MSFMRSRTLLATLILTCLFCYSPRWSGAQQTRTESLRAAIEARLLHVPAATYRLEATDNGRGYMFCNYSATRVVSFRLGCVQGSNEELQIVSKRGLEETSLAARSERNVRCRFWLSNHGLFPGQACDEGKLAVVEVALADGTIWALRP